MRDEEWAESLHDEGGRGALGQGEKIKWTVADSKKGTNTIGEIQNITEEQ